MSSILLTAAGGIAAGGILLQRATARHLASAAALPITLLRQRQASKSASLQICVGNEAGDLDSIVSSIAISFLKNALHQHTTTTTTTTRAIPLMPFPRSEFRLRRDAVYLFSLVGFQFDETSESPVELIFSDELERALEEDAAASEQPVLQLILTDHNKRTIEHSKLTNVRVVEIVDHHADSGDHPNVVGSDRNIVSGLASACTLVAESLLQARVSIPNELSLLLAATIILDARNWDPSKTTARDREAYEALLGAMKKIPEGNTYRDVMDRLYERTSKARFDVSCLQFDDLLKLDYKDCLSTVAGSIKCGIASIMKDCSTLVQESGVSMLEESMFKFAQAKKLDIVFGFCSQEQTGNKILIVCDVTTCSGSGTRRSTESLGISFLNFLHDVPGNLSSRLKGESILAKQQVIEQGLIAHGTTHRQFGSRCSVVELQGLISRKSLKPITEEWMQSNSGGCIKNNF